MRPALGASALALVSFASSVLSVAEECPPGYAPKGKINWVNCNIKAGEKLDLRLVRLPATDQSDPSKVRTIITNPGGPGESGIENVLGGGGAANQNIAGKTFNILSFDPRGVGLTNHYPCKPTDADGPGRLDTKAGIELTYSYWKAQADKCYKDAKMPGELVGTAFVARDIKAIAEAIDEDGLIRYWGYSYGTVLGATLAAMFPDKIERLVVDGNINPVDYWNNLGEETAADVDKAVENFFELCAKASESECGWKGTRSKEALLAKWNRWVGLDATTDTTALEYSDSYAVRNALFNRLKDPSEWRILANIFQQWYDDKRQIKNLPDSLSEYDFSANPAQKPAKRQTDGPGFNPLDSGSEANRAPQALSAISCGDSNFRPKVDATVFEQWLNAFRKVSKQAGDVATTNSFGCGPWTIDAKEKYRGGWDNIATKHPILVVQTKFDPVTPLASATRLKDAFLKSRLLVSSGVGHCSTADWSDDLVRAIGKYWKTGEFPEVVVEYAPNNRNPFVVSPPKNENGEGGTSNTPNQNKKRDVLPDVILSGEAFERRDIENGGVNQAIPASCTPISTTTTTGTKSATSATDSTTASTSASTTSTTISKTPSTGVSTSTTMNSGSASTSTVTSVSTSYITSTSSIISTTTKSVSISTSSPIVFTSTTYTTTTISTYTSTDSTTDTTTSTSTYSYTVSPITTSTSWSYTGSLITTSTKSYTWTDKNPVPDHQSSQWSDWSKWTTTTTARDPTWTNWNTWPNDDYYRITKTITATVVETVKKCPATVYNCPYTDLVTRTTEYTTCTDLPNKTVYTTGIVDVCETGLTTKKVTVTATCDKGCTAIPTGVPQGYTTSKVYCSACTTPSDVIVTVKAAGGDSNAYTDGSKPTGNTDIDAKSASWSTINVSSAKGTNKATPVDAKSTDAASSAQSWSGVQPTASTWVATYKGSATSLGVTYGSLVLAAFVGMFML